MSVMTSPCGKRHCAERFDGFDDDEDRGAEYQQIDPRDDFRQVGIRVSLVNQVEFQRGFQRGVGRQPDYPTAEP